MLRKIRKLLLKWNHWFAKLLCNEKRNRYKSSRHIENSCRLTFPMPNVFHHLWFISQKYVTINVFYLFSFISKRHEMWTTVPPKSPLRHNMWEPCMAIPSGNAGRQIWQPQLFGNRAVPATCESPVVMKPRFSIYIHLFERRDSGYESTLTWKSVWLWHILFSPWESICSLLGWFYKAYIQKQHIQWIAVEEYHKGYKNKRYS